MNSLSDFMVKRFLFNNGLTLVLMSIFLITWAGQLLAGHADENSERIEHGRPPLSLQKYMVDGAFWQATGENWESEFLQMAMFVVFTVFLVQKGSPESRDPDENHDPVDEDPRTHRNDPRAPWPVRKCGEVGLWIYSHSLSITFFVLFAASLSIHAAGGVRVYNEEQAEHGMPPTTFTGYLGTSRFWFESLQNWQSEFLSLAAMVWLSVYLRERGSAESKPVAAPHDDHGGH